MQSLLGRALKEAPEIEALPCVDPVESAADKVSALAWRTASRKRGSEDDDPAVIRHLHDLAALSASVVKDPRLKPLVLEILDKDAKRSKSDMSGRDLLSAMLPKIKADELWRREYEQFVGAVSFGKDDERISFDQAMDACEKACHCNSWVNRSGLNDCPSSVELQANIASTDGAQAPPREQRGSGGGDRQSWSGLHPEGYLPAMKAAIPFFRDLTNRRREATMAGDADGVRAFCEEARKLACKLDNCQPGIIADETSPGSVLASVTAAERGAVPLWGQVDSF